jgi:2-succinyl-5-enolpyruvyl-6-hydroxy-3-cyclohexene-1-carboxylate synthase
MALQKRIFRLSEICSTMGMKQVLLSPGSRSAALSIAFSRNPSVEVQFVEDERSAAFVALGKASEHHETVGLICTSGTAAYNLAPAVAEAFFQEIPLLIFTADRPPEWIHQYDGQTIYQEQIFGKHVKKSFQLPVDTEHKDAAWHHDRIVQEAMALSQLEPKGPVHINVPIREPFYPEKHEEYSFGTNKMPQISYLKPKLSHQDFEETLTLLRPFSKFLIVLGQDQYTFDLTEMAALVPVIVEATANLPEKKNCILSQDLLAKHLNSESEPEVLISFGKSILSKNFKNYLRTAQFKMHLHVQDNPVLIDPFQQLSHKLCVRPDFFLESLNAYFKQNQVSKPYFDYWQNLEKQARQNLKLYLEKQTWGQMYCIAQILLSNDSLIHVANSMPVRYVNILQTLLKKATQIYANRGTSGIDGSLSTAVGQALNSEGKLWCIIGDVSFFYDSNALYAQPRPLNLNVLLINNSGGNIFRQIQGPSETPELETLFVGNQKRTAKSIAEDTGISYFACSNSAQLLEAMASPDQKIIEVFTDPTKDVQIFNELINLK